MVMSERLNLQAQEKTKLTADLFLAECPNITEGINTQRVEAFVREKGLKLSAYRFGSFQDIEEAALKLPDQYKSFLLDWLETAKSRRNQACYWSPLGIALIPRDVALEAAGGAVQAEALLVHEAAGHGSSITSTQIIKFEGESAAIRDGFHTIARKRNSRGWGNWLEEAFAGRLQAHYKLFSHEPQRSKELSEILETEVDEGSTVAFTFEGHGWSYPILLPASYLDVEFLGYDPSGQKCLGVGRPHTAGFTLDLLIQNDPDLEQLLIDTRTNPVALREVAARIESIDKGLYGFLQRRTFPDEGFDFHECAVKYQRVLDIFYGGDVTKIFKGSSRLYDRLEEVVADSKK